MSLEVTTPLHRSNMRYLGPWYIAEFLMSYAANLYITGCYDWADYSLNAAPSTRLWLSALWGLEYIFISLIAGRVVEKMGPRRTAIALPAWCVLTAGAGLLAIAIPHVWMLLIVMLPFNITCSMIWPAIESGITRTRATASLSSRIAIYNLAWGSAGFVGIFSRGMLEKIHFASIFIMPALACGVESLILAKWAVPATQIAGQNVPDDPSGEHELDDPAIRRRAEKLLRMAWIGNAMSYVAIYVLLPVLTELIRQAGYSDLGVAGMIAAIWMLTRFLTFALAGRWTGWHYKIAWQIGPLAGLAASLAGMLLIAQFPPAMRLPVLIALQIVFGFSAAMLYSASLYYAMHVSAGHGGHAAFHEAVIGAGTLAGPLIGALASAGKLDEGAMRRIAFSVTSLLALGLIMTIVMAIAAPKRSSHESAQAR